MLIAVHTYVPQRKSKVLCLEAVKVKACSQHLLLRAREGLCATQTLWHRKFGTSRSLSDPS